MFSQDSLFGPFVEFARLDLPETTLSAPFEGLLGSFYTRLVTRAEADSSWFAEHAGPPGPAGVLEMCCGGGRSVLALAHRGWRVTGVDLSPTQLHQARTLIGAAGPEVAGRVSLVRGDVFGLDLARRFDAVVIGGLSLTLFEDQRRPEVFGAVRRHLGAGGRLLFDYTAVTDGERDTEAVMAFPVRTPQARGFVLVGARREPGQRRQLTNMYAELVEPDGRTRRWLTGFQFRLDTHEGLSAELAEHGFALRHAEPEEDYELDPDSPFGARQYVVAEVAG